MGIAAAMVFANLGSAYGTAKSGVGIASLAVIDSSRIFRGLMPVIMAGILGIYGIIISVVMHIFLVNGTYKQGYVGLASGLTVGLSSLASGLAIGVAGDAGVRAFAQTESVFVGLVLILIFAEAIALYGLIVAIILVTSG